MAQKKLSYKVCMLIVSLSIIIPSSAYALTVSGGNIVLNIDSELLANNIDIDTDPNVPSMYVEEYFNPEQADSRSFNQLLNDHIIPGTAEISAFGLQFDVKNSTDFSFDPSDIEGTAVGEVDFSGAIRFRVDTGQETNRIIVTNLVLKYGFLGLPEWNLFGGPEVFKLKDVESILEGDQLILNGKLALGSGFNHLGATHGAVVGGFNFQTTVVPVPAALWLFLSGFIGLVTAKGRGKGGF